MLFPLKTANFKYHRKLRWLSKEIFLDPSVQNESNMDEMLLMSGFDAARDSRIFMRRIRNSCHHNLWKASVSRCKMSDIR